MKQIALIICTLISSTLLGQSTLKGTVILDGEVAIGATVLLQDTRYGITTDYDGTYRIDNIPDGDYSVQVSYIGAETFTETIALEGGVKIFDVSLKSASQLIDGVTVTAKSEGREVQEQAIQIESIDIESVSTTIRDLNDAVDQLSGVRIRSSGSTGARSDIALNGLNGTAVRVYLDGLPLEFLFPSSGLNNLPMNNVKRIDVYKGVVPIQVGSDAMGGAINVIPSYKNINTFRGAYSIGSFGLHQLEASTNIALKENIILTANASHIQSDNDFSMNAYIWEKGEVGKVKRFNDAYRLSGGDVGIVFKDLGWADFIRVTGGYSDYFRELQHGGIIGRVPYGEIEYNGTNKVASLDYRKNITDNIEFKNVIAYAHENALYVDTTSATYSWSGEVITRRNRGEIGGGSDLNRNLYGLVNRTGINLNLGKGWDLAASNLLARQTVNGRDLERPIERDALQYDQVLTKNISGIELSKSLLDEKLELSTAAKLYNYHLETVDLRAFSPLEQQDKTYGYYGNFKYSITDDLFVRGSYEKAWRIPNSTQFFGNGLDIISNPGLKPESSDNFNAGVSFSKTLNDQVSINAEVNGFIRAQKDIIFLSPTVRSRYINAEEVSTTGIEMEVAATLWDNLRVQTNVTSLRKIYDKISDDNISSQFLEGTPFPNTPSLFGNAQVSYRIPDMIMKEDAFSIYVQHKYVDEFNFINVGKVRNENNWIPTQHRTNTGFSYALKDGTYSFSFNVNNVLNKELFDNYKIPRPGRNFNAKLIYNFRNI